MEVKPEVAGKSPLFSSARVGICPAIECGRNQDGCKQPGHGDGPQLPPMPVGRSADHLREHTQGDGFPANANSSPGHQLHRRRGVDPVSPALIQAFRIVSCTFTLMQIHFFVFRQHWKPLVGYYSSHHRAKTAWTLFSPPTETPSLNAYM